MQVGGAALVVPAPMGRLMPVISPGVEDTDTSLEFTD